MCEPVKNGHKHADNRSWAVKWEGQKKGNGCEMKIKEMGEHGKGEYVKGQVWESKMSVIGECGNGEYAKGQVRESKMSVIGECGNGENAKGQAWVGK
jgi:hypothetical protein